MDATTSSPAAAHSGLPVIEVKALSVNALHTDSRTVIASMNWTVQPGDFWVIASPAAGGKSALLQTLAGIQKPAHGDLFLFGRNTRSLNEEEFLAERLKLSLVFEGGGRLFGALSVAENIALPFCYHNNCHSNQCADQLDRILQLTELASYRDSLPSQVPRALRSRIGLARSLITRPMVLLVDNPLHGLDVRQARWWTHFLEALCRSPEAHSGYPLTLIVATDYLSPWLAGNRQFALVKEQRFAVLGGADGLQDHPDSLVQDLL